jgi:hypothetical protein
MEARIMDMTFTLGNIITIATCVSGLTVLYHAIKRMMKPLFQVRFEHELLMGWLCHEHGITRGELAKKSGYEAYEFLAARRRIRSERSGA